MASSLILEDQIEIPLGLGTLERFRQWAVSPAYPDRGRIDYLDGRIEVETSPEDLFCHGTLKTELVAVISATMKGRSAGHLFCDSTRVSCPAAQLSVEPDIVSVSEAAIASGRVRLVPASTSLPGRYIELEGAQELIVEIVSDSPAKNDTQRLPPAYFAAGGQ